VKDSGRAGPDRVGPGLPEELETLVERVLEAADLDLTQGRREVERELRAHFEDGLATGATPRELIARFGDPEFAGRRIRRTGPRAAARRRGEERRWWMSMTEWTTEATRAVRRLRRAPGFTAVVVVTLALGVGVNTAIFSVLNAVLLQDLPYAEPDRLVRLYENHEEYGLIEYLRAPAVAEWRGWDEVFDELAALYTYREVGADLTDGTTPERVDVLPVTAGYFETLGRRPLLGRTFAGEESYGVGAADDRETPLARVAVLSHGLWTRRFAADPEIVGQSVQLDGRSFAVIGVMPASFRDPFGNQADVWTPQDMRPGGSNHFGNYFLSGVARLRDGVSLEAAQGRLDALSIAYGETQPEMAATRLVMRPLQADLVGETRRTMLWILAAAAALVLLTACVNVANLLFAHGLRQDRALALRSALGSGRTRLVASILIENGFLALLGGGLGLWVGWVGVRALLGVAPEALPIVAEVSFGLPVFGFALAATVGALVLFGLTPAIRMSRTVPADVLRSGDRASTLGKAARRIRGALVVVQVAVALVVVTGAMLLTRSFERLLDVPLAIDEEGVLTFEVHLPTSRYESTESRVRFHRDFQSRIASLPGVEAVGATSWLPVNGAYHSWGIRWDRESPEGSTDDEWISTDVRVIEGDYFGALGIELLRGDPPSSFDTEGEAVAWVNELLAERVWGEVDPIGQPVAIGGTAARIVGVVEDVPVSSRGDQRPKSYLLHADADNRNWALIQTVKASVAPNALRTAIRDELRAMDPNLVMYRTQALRDVIASVRAQDRFATLLMGAFGLLALSLSLVGIYGVLSSTVAARTREIGIRVALGAGADSVRALVLRYGASLVVPGLLVGLALAWLGSRWLETLLFGVDTGDPVAYVAAIGAFVAVSVLAAWLPVRRATRVDTVEVLGAE
jgi:putative ABC transport system permease protein